MTMPGMAVTADADGDRKIGEGDDARPNPLTGEIREQRNSAPRFA
ncbi:MAG: hypothetical protein P9F19_05865 [Candidatus Contendobacter sp.]|nr:hypothetical protein [Candidatus Contendobacter sp.]MDG4556902.1 hypothetical protein [Candidatus Contendobacter sp.]